MTARLPSAELFRRAQSIRWWHSIPLGDGLVTPGTKPVSVQEELAHWKFPEDLRGKTFLDIGCNDGGYCVAAIARGAARVLGVDQFVQDGMRFLMEHRVYPFEFRHMDLFSDEFLQLPVFDFVLFAGVLYHVQDPIEALRRVRRVTGETTIIETHVDERHPDVAAMVFYEGSELQDDPSNWWGPNRLCLEAMLRTVGFQDIRLVYSKVDEGAMMGRAAYHASVDRATSVISTDFYAIDYRWVEAPNAWLAAMEVTVRVSVTNKGSSTWSSDAGDPVHLSHRWLSKDTYAVMFEGPRVSLRSLGPGRTAEVTMRIVTPATPGDYILQIDSVHEHVAWFSTRGQPPLERAIHIG